MRSCLTLAGIARGLVLLPATALASAYPASERYGGASHSVDTDTKVKALIEGQNTATQLSSTLEGLSPQDRPFVIARGQSLGHIVNKVVDVPAATTARSKTKRTAFIAASCPAWSRSHRFYSQGYSWAGLHLYDYYSAWAYSGMCYVHSATHYENSDWQAVGWSYTGSRYGSPYGSINSPMVGRETFGNFAFIKFALHDQIDQQVKVTGCWGQWGCGGWWVWSNATGA